MNGVRFYFDYGSAEAKRKGGDAPNALALFVDIPRENMLECRSALTYEANSPVCGNMASLDYIRTCCKRVSQAEAFRVHPRLMKDMLSEVRS